MKNPIAKARDKLGLSRHQLALVSGVGYAEVWRSEAGYARSLHPELASFLKREGIVKDPQKMYKEWLNERGDEIRLVAKLKRGDQIDSGITGKSISKKDGDSK